VTLNASRNSGQSAPAAARSGRPAEHALPAVALGAVLELDGAHDRPISPDHDRCLTPDQTLARIGPHFAELGITRLGEITGLDSLGIPVAFATRPNSFSLSVNLGKGRDPSAARASAAMEAVEIAVAERLPADCIEASQSALGAAGRRTVELDRIARCQPHRLDPDQSILWATGLDLFSGEDVLVPWALIGLDHRPNAPGYHDAFEVATDGLASGNSLAEAVLHGLCELVERDAFAQLELMPAGKLALRRRKLHALGPQLAEAIDRIALRGLDLRLFEMTSDIAIPAFFATLSQPAKDETEFFSWSSLCGGCGCHPSPERAMIRAVTEAAQARLAMAAGARDDLPRSHYQPADKFAEGSDGEQPGTPVRLAAAKWKEAMPAWMATSLGERIGHVLRALARAGLNEAIFVELPTGDLHASVARVIVPDLQVPLHGERTQVLARALRHLVEAVR